jgi:N-acetylglucosaminyldiphosphoundecaprenol N-acetyl-beta-D-mannosaminyltransferase
VGNANVLGIRIDPATPESLIDTVEQSVAARSRDIIIPINAHFLNLATENTWLKDLAGATGVHVVADGKGVMLASVLRGVRLPAQIRFADWVFNLFERATKKRLSFFFLGAEDEIVSRAATQIRKRYPGLQILGTHNGYFPKTSKASQEVVSVINEARPDILLLGMSMPVEEQWIWEHRSRLDAGVIVLGSGCFEWLAGRVKSAPRWVSAVYCEWLFRLLQEPRRLWRRYLIGNPLFLFRILRHQLIRQHDGNSI